MGLCKEVARLSYRLCVQVTGDVELLEETNNSKVSTYTTNGCYYLRAALLNVHPLQLFKCLRFE